MTNKRQIHKINPEQYLTVSSEEQMTMRAPQTDMLNIGRGTHLTGSGRGGRREGAGRKKGQRIKEDFELKKARSIRMTDEEYPQVIEYLRQLRADKKQQKKPQ